MINEIFGFNEAIIGIDRQKIEPLTDQEFEWFKAALSEELGEIEQAHQEQDLPKFVDGILDLCYFAIGGLKRTGLNTQQAVACFNAIHEANMTKQLGKQEKRGNFALDATKPDNFVPAETQIAKILFE